MEKDFDFDKAKRGPAVAAPGKTRITIMLDDDVLEAFREQAKGTGRGYQTRINAALREHVEGKSKPEAMAKTVRRAVRDEFKRAFASGTFVTHADAGKRPKRRAG